MTDKRKPQLEPTVNTTGVDQGFDHIAQKGRQLGESLEKSGQQGAKGIDSIGDGAEASAQKVDRATKNIIGSIERATAAAKSGQRGTADFFEALARQRGVSGDALKPYIDQLREAERMQAATAGSLGRLGMTAGQTAQALRQVPMQFTDIFTSIAAGQPVMQVALQQGGQLKDAFGGIGAAAGALAGYVASLITPFTMLAAAAAAVAYAYQQGAAESKAFEKTLITTGNMAGVTAGQLSDIAKAVGQLGGATQGRAAEILNQLAASGAVGASNFKAFTATALEFQRVGGAAAEDTVKAFQSLAKAPLEASLKLAESTGFLTAATVKQIQALEEQGRTADAARAAQEAYAAALNQRIPELEANLGTLEVAWMKVATEAKRAWDRMANIGRPSTVTDQLAAVRAQLAELDTPGLQLKNASFADRYFNSFIDIAEVVARMKAPLQEQERLLQRSADAAATLAREQGKANDDAKKLAGFYKENEKFLTKTAQMERELGQAREGYQALVEKGLLTEVQYRTLLLNIRDKYKEAPGKAETNKELEAEARLIAELSGLAGDYQQNLTRLQAARASGNVTEERYVELVTELIRKQPFAREQAKELADANKLAAKAFDDVTKAYERQVEEYAKAADSAAQQVQRLQDEEKAAAIAAASNISLAQAVQQVVSARLADQQAKELAAGNQEAADAIQREIDKRRELAGLIGNKDSREATAKAAKDAADAWKRATDDINRDLTDALLRGFESGKGFAENFRDVVVNMFKTMVLRPVISAIVQPVAGQLANGIGSLLGGGNPLGMVGSANSAYNLAAAGAGLWGSSAAYGAALGTTSIGAGSQAAMLAAQTGVFGAEGAAMTAAAAGNAGVGSLMGSIGAAAPYLAAVLAVVAIAKSLDNSGTPHTGASSSFSSGTGLLTGAGLNGVGSKAGDYSTQTESLTSGIVQGIVGILDSTATTFGKQAGYTAAAAFADDSSKDGAWGALAIKLGEQMVAGFGAEGNGRWPGRGFGDGEAGTKEYLAAVSADVRRALDDIGLPSWAKGMLDNLGSAPAIEQLAGTVAQINATQSALANLGSALPQLAGLAGEAVTGLLTAFGGVESLTNAAGSYYQNFYSEAERAAAGTRQITKALGDLGYGLPTSREGFRALVEAQDLATESGRTTYAALLKLSPAFAEITAATTTLADTTAQAAAQMAEAGRKALADLAGERGGLNVDLLRAQGNTAEADALARQQALAKITAGLSTTDAAAATAAYDFNEALRQQIAALGLAKTAAEQLATQQAQQAAQALAQQQAVASQRYGLEGQLLQLQGNTVALRERELAALDASNRALQQQIYALTDQQAAAAAAAQALQAFQSTLDGLGSTRFDLENELLGLQGKSEEVARRTRERDLAQLTAGLSATDAAKVAAAYDLNTALKQQIADTQAAQRAAEEMAAAQARAAEESARAAEQFKNAWQSVTDSIFSEVARIRGLVAGQSPLSFANAQAQFAIATGQARAGDQEAAKLLPGLSQTLLQLAEAQATSLAELQLIRARTAASLTGTGSGLAGMYGLTIPRLATGTNFVPRDMLAMLHAGEEVTPRAWNPAAGGAARDERLLAAIEGLRADNHTQALRIVELQLQLNKLLRKWDLDGIPEERVTTA